MRKFGNSSCSVASHKQDGEKKDKYNDKSKKLIIEIRDMLNIRLH